MFLFFFLACCFLLAELPWPLQGSGHPQLLSSPSLSSHSPAVPMAPFIPGLAQFIPPAHPEPRHYCEENSGAPGWCLIKSCYKWWETPPKGGFASAQCLPPCKRPATNQTGLPEGVGKGYVNVEVTLWLVCTVHTEAQSSRVPTACCKCKDCKKLSKTNNIFILFRFSNHHRQIHAAALTAGQVIHPSAHSKHQCMLLLHPFWKQIQRTTKHEALLPRVDRNTTVCARLLSPPLPSRTPFGIHNPSSYLKPGWEGWTLTEHNESVLSPIKHWQKYF